MLKHKFKASQPFVVKLQCSLFGETRTVLAYDSGHNVLSQEPATKEIARKIGDRSFWWAVVKNDIIVVDSKRRATEDEYEQFDYQSTNGRKR